MRFRVFTALAVSLLLVSSASCIPKTSEPGPLAEFVTNPTTPIFINPRTRHVLQGGEFGFNIEVMPAGWGVSAGEVTLSYDSNAFELLEVRRGDLLGTDALVGVEKIDRKSGTITYALARAGATVAPGRRGVLATVILRVKVSAKGSFRAEIVKAGLANEKFEDIKGLRVQGATIIVD